MDRDIVLKKLGSALACVLFFLFVGWFLIMAGSSYKKEQANDAYFLQEQLQMEVDTCVMRKDMAAWLKSQPVPDQYAIDCKAAILAANPFKFQPTAWERFKARMAYLFN